MDIKYLYKNKENQTLSDHHESTVTLPIRSRKDLKADCESCFGLCCVALYFSASEGFPIDKIAGQPCPNLQSDFRCGVHKNLREIGLKGCCAFDCFGAGPKVAKITCHGQDWRQHPESAKKIFEGFLIMRQLYELLWYLDEAQNLEATRPIHKDLASMWKATESLTNIDLDSLLVLDVSAHRSDVNVLLLQTSELVRSQVLLEQKAHPSKLKTLKQGSDLIGADLRKTDLRGSKLRGAYLIAADLRNTNLSGADLIGADFRDADLRGADLSQSIFLTQAQINVAKGDVYTKLPPSLEIPTHWSN